MFESGDSTGEVDLRKLAGLIIRGGWPGNLEYSPKEASEAIKEYINLIVEDDLYRLDGINRDKHKVKLLLKSLARNESTTVSNMTLKKDINEVDNEDIDIDTVASYLNALDKLYLLDNDEPFASKMRSSLRVKQSEKRHFADPSIACAFEIKLGANKIEEAAKNLLNLKSDIEKVNEKVPAVLCVICGLTNSAYRRLDGVYVVPITALKP